MTLLEALDVKAAWKWLKSGSGGKSTDSDLTRLSIRRRSTRLASSRSCSSSVAILTSTSIRNATELRVVPMLVMNSTVLREVLLIWMPYLSIRYLFLKVSPSMPVWPR